MLLYDNCYRPLVGGCYVLGSCILRASEWLFGKTLKCESQPSLWYFGVYKWSIIFYHSPSKRLSSKPCRIVHRVTHRGLIIKVRFKVFVFVLCLCMYVMRVSVGMHSHYWSESLRRTKRSTWVLHRGRWYKAWNLAPQHTHMPDGPWPSTPAKGNSYSEPESSSFVSHAWTQSLLCLGCL